MDTSKSRTATVVNHGISNYLNGYLWTKKRAFMGSLASPEPSYVFKIPVADQPCSDLCSTCHEVHRDQCLSCQPLSSLSSSGGTTCVCNDGYYGSALGFTTKECLACSELCATCNGGASTNCLTCKDERREVKGDGTCGCRDGYFLSGNSCLPCHSSCATCSSPAANACLSCAEAGYFLKLTTCVSCAAETSTGCPSVTTVTVQDQIQEFTRTLELDFSPSLKDQMTNANQESLLSVENLLKNNLKITFGNDDESQSDITVLETRISHLGAAGDSRLPDSTTSSTGQTHSFVYITFLQNLRKNNSDYVKISLKSPWIYKPTSRAQHQQTVYLRDGWTQKILVKKKVNSREEDRLETAGWLGKDFTAVLGVITPVPTIIAFILAWTTNFLGSFIRLFNVANVVANIGKMKVKLAMNVNATFTFADNIKIPEWEFLAENSSIEDYDWSEKEREAHQKLLRGIRGKITINNDRVFLGSGQSF